MKKLLYSAKPGGIIVDYTNNKDNITSTTTLLVTDSIARKPERNRVYYRNPFSGRRFSEVRRMEIRETYKKILIGKANIARQQSRDLEALVANYMNTLNTVFRIMPEGNDPQFSY
jgi:hypothetical protein